MTHAITKPIPAGTHVRVQQTIRSRAEEWTTTIEGEVISHKLEPTGSWYAHDPKDKLLLSRLRLKKADGELTTLNLDDGSIVTLLG